MKTNGTMFHPGGSWMSATVAVSSGHGGYPAEPPYSPKATTLNILSARGPCRTRQPCLRGARDALRLLGLDAEHYGGRTGIRWASA